MPAGGTWASGYLQAPPQPSHHFCPAPWAVMGYRGQREGAPDLVRSVRLTSEERRDARAGRRGGGSTARGLLITC